ncbi:MAG: molecular chaperone DnaJ, partial [Clostridia bacterium]|nr:molecular chaperone DnaJ [Clostridia bacterium]
TQNDAEFRIRGQGIQMLRSASKGDLVVRIRVEIPKRLNEKQKELLRQFDETVTGREYEGKKNFFEKLKDAFN